MLFAYSVVSSYLLQCYAHMDFMKVPFYKHIKLEEGYQANSGGPIFLKTRMFTKIECIKG